MTLRGRDHTRRKTVINSNITEQVNTYNYLGCALSYEKEKFVPNKLPNSYRSKKSSVKF